MGDFVCTEFIRDTVTERGTVEIQCGGRMNAAPPSVGGCVTGPQLGAPQGMPATPPSGLSLHDRCSPPTLLHLFLMMNATVRTLLKHVPRPKARKAVAR